MSVQTAVEIKFSKELLAFIEDWKEKPGNLIMVLHKVQEELGFVPRQAAIMVSDLLEVPLAKVYGVMTFYHFFKQTKPGKYNIQVCMGTACYLKGGDDLLLELESVLGIGINQVTEDGMFSYESVRCLGCCGLAPVLTAGGEVFGKLTKDSIPEIIAKLKQKG
ncbi:MAG: NAD(P)H-dependent oxidoreductase subunit E [Spirochaetia bacterium]|jgi:NADH-quinone oxidoreductase subunit E|nr:NAD(P)H-dependent oxidoreductase subunit E [Spirochaetia bacterium]